MKTKLISFFIFLFNITWANTPDGKKTFQSKVIEHYSHEGLAGAKIEVKNTSIVVYADFDGNFTINNMPVNACELVVTHFLYEKNVSKVEPNSTTFNLSLRAID